MTSTDVLFWVGLGRYVLPALTAIALLAWLPIKSFFARSGIATVIGWILAVVYTIYVYNPAGVAAGRERGLHFPESIYDNNTVTVAILAGWFYPLVGVGVYWLAHR